MLIERGIDLIALREKHDITQHRLCKLAKCDVSAYVRVENEHRSLTLRLLRKIAPVLGYRVEVRLVKIDE